MTEKRTMAKSHDAKPRRFGTLPLAAAALSLVWSVPGCFDPVYPQLDRETRIMAALERRDSQALPAGPLGADEAVAYALANNLDNRVAEIEASYQNESLVASRRRLLPSLTARYSLEHANHPAARWSRSTKSGSQSLETSYSSDPDSRQGEIGMMWNLIDFGVGYLRSRQQGERVRHAELQRRRVRQQVVLDVLTHYWRAAAAQDIALRAEELTRKLDELTEAIRDSVEMRILSGAEGARRELAMHNGLVELEQWRRTAVQERLELARVMGCGAAAEFALADFPAGPPRMPEGIEADPEVLQTAALNRRPELYQQDAQERIAVDEARVALLQMAPNANLSLALHHDPDKFLEWTNWMTVGARATWNLFNIPARVAERRVAKLQGDAARQKGLALAAAIMAQVGIAYSDWRLSHSHAESLYARAVARERLVEALAAGEKDNQTRPGEVLQERVRLLSDRAAAMRAAAETRIAGARLANAIGLEANDLGQFVWDVKADPNRESGEQCAPSGKGAIRYAEATAAELFPDRLAGLRVVREGGPPAAAAFAASPPRSASEPGAEAVTDNVDRTEWMADGTPAGRPETAESSLGESGVAVRDVPQNDTDIAAGLFVDEEFFRFGVDPEGSGVATPSGAGETDASERGALLLPEELQALRPSAHSFGGEGGGGLPRNEFAGLLPPMERVEPPRSAPSAPSAFPAFTAVPPGSLRPEGTPLEFTEASSRPPGDAPERPASPGREGKSSLRPPAPAPTPEGFASGFVVDDPSWEERRLRALEPLPSLDASPPSPRPGPEGPEGMTAAEE